MALCVVEDEHAPLGWVGCAPVEAAHTGLQGVAEQETERGEGGGGLVGGAGRARQPHEDCVVGLGGACRVERELAEAGMERTPYLIGGGAVWTARGEVADEGRLELAPPAVAEQVADRGGGRGASEGEAGWRLEAAVVEREPEEVAEEVLLGLGLPGFCALDHEVAIGERLLLRGGDEVHGDGVEGGGLDPERFGVVGKIAGGAERVADGLVEAEEGAVAGLQVEAETAIGAAGGTEGALEGEVLRPQNDRSLRTLLEGAVGRLRDPRCAGSEKQRNPEEGELFSPARRREGAQADGPA